MADPRFFRRSGPFTLAEIAEVSHAVLRDSELGSKVIIDVAPLEGATSNELTFLDNRKYADAFSLSGAGASFVTEALVSRAPSGMALLVSAEPYKSYARAAQAFYPALPIVPNRCATAIIDPTALISDDCEIGHFAVIGASVRIGKGCRIGAHSVIGEAVEIGSDCEIGSQVTLSHCVIGDRVVLHPGVRIGQPGFGFAPDPQAPVKVPQLGRVVIGDDVDVGANTTIDRGSGHDTVIGSGSMIDNLVQIGHNVVLGRGCILAGQVGISGSTKLGDFVVAGGQAGLAGHLQIGTGARIAARSGLMRDVAAGATVCGTPAVPIGQFMRQVAVVERLAKKKDG